MTAQPPSRAAILRHLLRLAAPYWRWIALSTLLGFLTIASSVSLLATSAWIISKAALQPSIAEIQVAVVGVRFFGIARAVLRYLERLVSHNTTFKVLARLRVWFYAALEPLAPARLMQMQSGDLLSRIMADVGTLEEFYVRVLAPPLVAAAVLGGMLIFMGSVYPPLAVIVLGGMMALGLGAPLLTRWLGREPGRAAVHTRAALDAAAVDAVQGMAEIVAFGAQSTHLARLDALSADLERTQRRMARLEGLQAGLGVLIVSLTAFGVLAAAISHVDGVNLATLTLATIASFEAITPLPLTFQHLEEHLTAAGRLFEIVAGVTPTVIDPDTPARPPASGALAITDLTFRYPDSPPALKGVTFSVPEGSFVAIVGPSGAGKSTLVNLLLRFWDYETGEIRLGGAELHTLRADDVRARISVVTQHTHLFNTTIRENLRLARPEASEADLIAAAQQAHIHAFIPGLPRGYDTLVGEQGLALSGGERQRLAIARALLKDAPLLVLDEPTANLDAVTEQAILRTLHATAASRQRTILLITHRLTGLEAADEILVMQAGGIVERGTHAALLAQDGLYRQLHALQGRLLSMEG
ncbi:MAG: thiol reductant ABC exporter subunit CydC [Anaerolineae bacterium]